MASLFIGHAAQKSKLHNLQYDEGGNHMAEAEAEAEVSLWVFFIRIKMINQYILVLHSLIKVYLKLMSFC